MPTLAERQSVHHAVLRHFMDTGRAPHYTDLSGPLQVSTERARQLVREVIPELPFSFTWLVPDTDYISSMAPFSNVPTPYRVSIGGVQKWYGQ